jgi:pimeloyl-ACP methyl ester carboxylesterase
MEQPTYLFRKALTGEWSMFRNITLVWIIAFATLIAPAQNSIPKSDSAPSVVTSPDFDEEGYRQLDPTLQFFRRRSAREYAIDKTKGVDDASFVRIGGIEQWITVRGTDRTNPMVLFVHGGPGEATNMWSYPFFLEWEKHFTVVQWDQRGAGRTFSKSGRTNTPDMTRERIAQDGVEVADYLCKHYGQRKIILLGQSWGTVIGLRMVQIKPELFAAYVGTGQVADETLSYSVAYRALLAKARAIHDEQAIGELTHVGPPPYTSGEGFQVQRRWSNRFEGADKFLPGTIGLCLQAPGYTVTDLDDLLAGEVFSADRLASQTTTMKDFGLKFSVPMFFFEGTEDFTTPTELARKYMDALEAPRKEYVPIQGGHFAVFIHSDEFLKQLLTRVRPLALSRG